MLYDFVLSEWNYNIPFFGMKTAKKQGAMLYDFIPFRELYNGM